MKLVQQISMETKQRLSAVQQIREQIALLQSQPQMIRRTSSTTPVPATPTSRVRPHRKLHNRYRLKSVSSHDDNTTALIQHETQGVFTSAPATPESQQNLIVQNLSNDQSTDQQDQYPLPDHFSPIGPSSASTNQGFSTNQRSPDQRSLNQHTSDQHSPSQFLNQHTSDQYSPDRHPPDQHTSDQRTPDRHTPPDVASDRYTLNQHASDEDPIQTDTIQLSPTHS